MPSGNEAATDRCWRLEALACLVGGESVPCASVACMRAGPSEGEVLTAQVCAAVLDFQEMGLRPPFDWGKATGQAG